MKIIFLDIDGVLNSRETIMSNHEKRQRGEFTTPKIDGCGSDVCAPHKTLVDRLNKITGQTGAYIVVSSTWRINKTVVELRELLRAFGVTGTVLDKTPRLFKRRGFEIQEWLDKGSPYGEIEKFVIIDDDSDMEHLMPHLIKTTNEKGLQDEHVKEAIERLNA